MSLSSNLLARPALSCFHTVYKFIRACYTNPVRLWTSAREELTAFHGIMPLIVSRWDLGWSTTVLAYDSCEEGRGVCVQDWPEDRAKQIGRVLERSRFKRNRGGLAPRMAALRQLDPFSDPGTVTSAPPDLSDCLEEWTLDPEFKEVPVSWMCERPWKVQVSRMWKHEQSVHVGEARAGVAALEGWASQPGACGQRVLRLGDNLGVVLALERKRAHAFPLLVQVRRSAAIELARGVRVAERWVPSEINPSDEPSRVFHETEARVCRPNATSAEDGERAVRGHRTAGQGDER